MSDEPVLLQHKYGGDDEHTPWRVLMITILLQRTSGPQVDQVCESVFENWPTPEKMQDAAPGELERVIRPCGMAKKRANVLIGTTERWIDWDWDHTDGDLEFPAPDELLTWPGIGPYTAEAFKMIVWGDTSFEPNDVRLKVWWEWQRKI